MTTATRASYDLIVARVSPRRWVVLERHHAATVYYPATRPFDNSEDAFSVLDELRTCDVRDYSAATKAAMLD